jgi:hypothetical protein
MLNVALAVRLEADEDEVEPSDGCEKIGQTVGEQDSDGLGEAGDNDEKRGKYEGGKPGTHGKK